MNETDLTKLKIVPMNQLQLPDFKVEKKLLTLSIISASIAFAASLFLLIRHFNRQCDDQPLDIDHDN